MPRQDIFVVMREITTKATPDHDTRETITRWFDLVQRFDKVMAWHPDQREAWQQGAAVLLGETFTITDPTSLASAQTSRVLLALAKDGTVDAHDAQGRVVCTYTIRHLKFRPRAEGINTLAVLNRQQIERALASASLTRKS